MHRRQVGLRNTTSWASPRSSDVRRHATHLYSSLPCLCGVHRRAVQNLQITCFCLHQQQGATKSVGRRISKQIWHSCLRTFIFVLYND